MHRHRDRKYLQYLLIFLFAGLFLVLSAMNARALPSFSRQTSMTCGACHTVFPELTPFGRTFKCTGYTLSATGGTGPYSPPISAAFQASATSLRKNDDILTNGVAPFGNPKDSATDRYNLPQEAAVFYAGRIGGGFGALVEVEYDGTANGVALDMTDIRYAHVFPLGGTRLILGFTLNNSPTLEDLWNTVPTWSFPYVESEAAPTPGASPLINGLGEQVGGLGIYAQLNELAYAAFTIYRTTENGLTRPLGAGSTIDPVIEGAMPYWRFALFHNRGNHSVEAGTYGLYARIEPAGITDGSTDKFTDIGFDFQYQYIASPHLFSIQATWIDEKQDWDATYKLGDVANRETRLNQFKVNANYHYRAGESTYGGTIGYFRIDGDKDGGLYAPNPVDGSRTGSPNSDGFILELDYLIRERYKFTIQYTIYKKFNGSVSNYDGFGRDASDNNTLYFMVWLAF